MGVLVSWQKHAEVLEKDAYTFFVLLSRFYSETETEYSSEMSVNLYRQPRGQISADADLHSYWTQNVILVCHFHHLSRPFTSKTQNKIHFCIKRYRISKRIFKFLHYTLVFESIYRYVTALTTDRFGFGSRQWQTCFVFSKGSKSSLWPPSPFSPSL